MLSIHNLIILARRNTYRCRLNDFKTVLGINRREREREIVEVLSLSDIITQTSAECRVCGITETAVVVVVGHNPKANGRDDGQYVETRQTDEL